MKFNIGDKVSIKSIPMSLYDKYIGQTATVVNVTVKNEWYIVESSDGNLLRFDADDLELVEEKSRV